MKSRDICLRAEDVLEPLSSAPEGGEEAPMRHGNDPEAEEKRASERLLAALKQRHGALHEPVASVSSAKPKGATNRMVLLG